MALNLWTSNNDVDKFQKIFSNITETITKTTEKLRLTKILNNRKVIQ